MLETVAAIHFQALKMSMVAAHSMSVHSLLQPLMSPTVHQPGSLALLVATPILSLTMMAPSVDWVIQLLPPPTLETVAATHSQALKMSMVAAHSMSVHSLLQPLILPTVHQLASLALLVATPILSLTMTAPSVDWVIQLLPPPMLETV